MRKALVAATVMGLVAGFATAASASEVKVGGQIKTTVTSDNKTSFDTKAEIKLWVDAKVSENVSAKVKLIADDDYDAASTTTDKTIADFIQIDEAYFKVSNLFDVENLSLTTGYKSIVMDDSKIMDDTFDSIILGCDNTLGKAIVGVAEKRDGDDVKRTYILANIAGSLEAAGLGGAYEIGGYAQTDEYTNPGNNGVTSVAYTKIAPEFATDYGKVGVKVEGAINNYQEADKNHHATFYAVGANLDAGMFGFGVSYDVYNNLDGYKFSPFEDYDYAEVLDNRNIDEKILTVEGSVKPIENVKLSAAYVKFDYSDSAVKDQDEVDLKAKYAYSDNLEFGLGVYIPSTEYDYQVEGKVTLKF